MISPLPTAAMMIILCSIPLSSAFSQIRYHRPINYSVKRHTHLDSKLAQNSLDIVTSSRKNHRLSRIVLFSDPKNGDDDGEKKGLSMDNISKRFLNPKLDDPGLPLADALVAQIVAPSLQVFWLGINHAPLPTWLTPLSSTLFATRGALVAPTLIHGAGLASCWIAGALAAKAYEKEAFDVSGGKGYGEVVARVAKAGTFAVGVLILGTQVDLFLEFGRNVQLGESEESDFRLLCAIVEIINDVVFEALTISGWRLFLASRSADKL